MTRETAKQMILNLAMTLDYDVYKSLLPELAEEPEFADDLMEELIDIVIEFTGETDEN